MESVNTLERWLVALRVACIDYHSGQFSRGYALGCALDRHFDKSGTYPSRISGWEGFLNDDSEIEMYYGDIVAKFGDSL